MTPGAPLTGGCACGAVRYRIDAAPGLAFLCRCRECQRMTGTGHAAQFVADRHALRLWGATAEWSRTTDAGQTVTKSFCPACGSPLFTATTRAPDAVMVLAGSLDDPSRFTPERIFYAQEGPAWDHPHIAPQDTPEGSQA